MEIAYGGETANASHRFDYYPAPDSPSTAPLLVFVHGGAWRSEDKADHAQLALALAQRTSCPVAVPNYRLTTPQDPIQHPAHASDVLLFLHFLCAWPGPNAPDAAAAPSRALVLIGHSCSAHILASILLTSPFPELVPSAQLLAATRAVVLSEGIYDLDALLRSFPDYKQWFIANAFADRAVYPHVNVASYPLRRGTAHVRWLVLHSRPDVLVDQLQSEIMYEHLVASVADPAMVVRNFDELQEGHNELLKGVVYPRIVADFVAGLAAPPA